MYVAMRRFVQATKRLATILSTPNLNGLFNIAVLGGGVGRFLTRKNHTGTMIETLDLGLVATRETSSIKGRPERPYRSAY